MNSLWQRLSFSFLAVMLLALAFMAWRVQVSVEASFSQYVRVSTVARFGGDIVAALEAHYAQTGSWAGVEALLPMRGRGQGAGGGADGRGAQLVVADAEGVIVAATEPEWVGQRVAAIGPTRQTALQAAGRIVGILAERSPGAVALDEAEARFAAETTRGLLLTGGLGGLAALALGLGLSYTLTRPLRALTEDISRWSGRSQAEPVAMGGSVEIRRLAAAFNDLRTRVAAGEQQRQRMAADIAHELRTPVTVMRGQLEAMMDGVYPLDSQHLAVAYDQALHLARLVEDLRLLTQAEAGRLPLHLAPLDLAALAVAAVERFRPLADDQDIRLATRLPTGDAWVQADRDRLQQVFNNLLGNALRHTPPQGQIALEVRADAAQVTAALTNDTTEPLDDETLAHLFDRFWRGDSARTRDTGGSGLGLAITRELLRLHGGGIRAERTEGGLCFVLTLPRTPSA